MIRVFFGENSFALERALTAARRDFSGTPESYDGALLNPHDLPNLLMGATLFADKRLVIIRGLSENTDAWKALPVWLERVSDDITLVLVETKLDKRTTEYRALQAHAELREFKAMNDRDTAAAAAWVIGEAENIGFTMTRAEADFLVRRVGVNQWELFHALQVLEVADDSSRQAIEHFIDARPSENIFSLLETALSGNAKRTSDMLKTLALTEDPYMLLGLVSSQAIQVAAFALADPKDNPAKDFAVSPYSASNYQNVGRRAGKAGVHKLVTALAEADADIKLSKAEPWLLIERALLSVSH